MAPGATGPLVSVGGCRRGRRTARRSPRELEHVRDELDAAQSQLLDGLPAIVGLDRDQPRGAPHGWLGVARCPGPENQLEVVPLDADGQKPALVGRRVLNSLLHAEDVRVEVEPLLLVADEHAHVEDLLQHCCASSGRGHYFHDKARVLNATAKDTRIRRARARAANSCMSAAPPGSTGAGPPLGAVSRALLQAGGASREQADARGRARLARQR